MGSVWKCSEGAPSQQSSDLVPSSTNVFSSFLVCICAWYLKRSVSKRFLVFSLDEPCDLRQWERLNTSNTTRKTTVLISFDSTNINRLCHCVTMQIQVDLCISPSFLSHDGIQCSDWNLYGLPRGGQEKKTIKSGKTCVAPFSGLTT